MGTIEAIGKRTDGIIPNVIMIVMHYHTIQQYNNME